jgi:hypothetical protein
LLGFDVHSHAFILAPWRASGSLASSVRSFKALLPGGRERAMVVRGGGQMNKQFGWAAIGALGLVIGCGGGGTTTTGSGGSASTTTGAGGGSTATSTATGTGGGSATSTAAATTGTGGGSAGEACTSCVGTKNVFMAGSACAKSLADCNADADCDSWFKCVQNCEASSFSTACFAACDQSASVVANLYQPVYDCTCMACKTECSPACP